MTEYHDVEWGAPTDDDRALFELLVLEGAQAGLSWKTVLERRAGYRRVFARFDPVAVAGFGHGEQAAAMADAGIVRHRAKVASAVGNARAWLEVAAEHGTFAAYLWDRVDGVPVVNHWRSPDQVPTTTPLAAALSRDLRARGFTFVGPIIAYAYLQAAGVVMDHLVGCFRHPQLSVPARYPRPSAQAPRGVG